MQRLVALQPPVALGAGEHPEPGLRSPGQRDGHRAVDRHDRRRLVGVQRAVQRGDLRPVGRLDRRRPSVQRGDRRLQLVRAGAAQAQRAVQRRHPVLDAPRVPARAVLLAQRDHRAGPVGARGAARVGQEVLAVGLQLLGAPRRSDRPWLAQRQSGWPRRRLTRPPVCGRSLGSTSCVSSTAAARTRCSMRDAIASMSVACCLRTSIPRAVRPGGQVGLLGLPALGLDLQDFALILLFGCAGPPAGRSPSCSRGGGWWPRCAPATRRSATPAGSCRRSRFEMGVSPPMA